MEKLNIKESRKEKVENFSEAHRLKPYIKILEKNPDFYEELKSVYPDKIKDNWDCVVELYRYNIKLSKSIYPYVAILENVLKIRLSNYLKEKFGENFYYNNELIFETLDFDDFDKKLFDEYFNHKINKFVRERLMKKYKEHNPSLSNEKIKSKINKIKIAVSILTDAQEYRFRNPYSSFSDFVESKPTLNYWITLLELEKLYSKNDESNNFELKQIFPNIKNESIKSMKTIVNKLNDVRALRNHISHYNQIIYKNISKNLELWSIYKNIIELFNLLDCQNVNYMIGDINCCPKGSFEGLYKDLIFIHQRFINNYYDINGDQK